MTRRSLTRQSLTRAGIVAAAVALPLAIASAPAQAADMATVSVLHAIPEGSGADVVDVFANGDLLIDNFTPGTLETVEVPAGTYDLAVFGDGQTPDDADPVLIAEAVAVPGGANATVTANLDADGAPALNVFVNDIAALAAGEARVIVRHIAAAPAVDVLAGGDVLFGDVTNPNEGVAVVPAGDYEVAVNLAGTDTMVLGPADVMLEDGTVTIVYAWGSAADENLALATQVITDLSSGPEGVPAGGGSTAQLSIWMIAAAALGAAGLVGAGARLATTRS